MRTLRLQKTSRKSALGAEPFSLATKKKKGAEARRARQRRSRFFIVPDGAEILCVEDRALEPRAEWKRQLLEEGGNNRFGRPHYRIIWGFRRATYYPVHLRSFWHLERWLPPEVFGLEEEWERSNKIDLENDPKAIVTGYPHQGDYFTIHTCRLPGGAKPNRRWIHDALILSKLKINRSRQEILQECRAQRLHQKQVQRANHDTIMDVMGVSEVIDDWVRVMKGNPAGRKAVNSPFTY